MFQASHHSLVTPIDWKHSWDAYREQTEADESPLVGDTY